MNMLSVHDVSPSEAAYINAKLHAAHGGRLRSYRVAALQNVLATCHAQPVNCSQMDIYQFGVYTGISMQQILWAMDTRSVDTKHWTRVSPNLEWMRKQVHGAGAFPRRLWGFDSFMGLPAEVAQGKDSDYIERNHFANGTWDARKLFRTSSPAKLMDKVYSYLNDTRVHLVKGFYSKSLTNELAREMRPALYVDIDCDLYSSAAAALSWLFQHRLVRRGTVIGYDDWAQGGSNGEQKAHLEMSNVFGVKFQKILIAHGGAAFRVL